MTMSHLRFGPKPIEAPYLIEANQANFVACHQFNFMERFDMLKYAKEGATFLLNSMYDKEEVWEHLPQEVQSAIIEKKLKFYVINGYEVAEQTGMGQRMNTIMQTAFFAISGVLPREQAIERSRKPSKRPTANAVKLLCRRTSKQWMRPSRTFMRSKSQRRSARR
jgi:pyruvate-ferredoxin/flavodoxin oxidoreductase